MMHLAILPTTRVLIVVYARQGAECAFIGQVVFGCNIYIGGKGDQLLSHLQQNFAPGFLAVIVRSIQLQRYCQQTGLLLSNEEAKRKVEKGNKMTRHVGETARYDWHGGNVTVLSELNDPDYTSKERVMPLLLRLQNVLQESCSDDENE